MLCGIGVDGVLGEEGGGGEVKSKNMPDMVGAFRIKRQISLVAKWREEIDVMKAEGKTMTPYDIKREMEFAAHDPMMKELTHFEKWCIAEIEKRWELTATTPSAHSNEAK